MSNDLKLVECPRDAMQGIKDFIPTEQKVAYLNTLLKCGFHTLDAGSFVSPKAIPQMQDTAKVLNALNQSKTKLLVIVANTRGAEEAVKFERVSYLGYPFSVSEEFQKRNTNASIDESFSRVDEIQNLAIQNNKEVVLYLSMGFGNPYGEYWHPDMVAEWSRKIYDKLGIKILAPSDTIGAATTDVVNALFSTLIKDLPEIEFGAHLHTVRENAKDLVKSAYDAGCRRFDGALKGFGGCPMAKDDLTGNMPTELMLDWFNEQNINTGIDMNALDNSMMRANNIFL